MPYHCLRQRLPPALSLCRIRPSSLPLSIPSRLPQQWRRQFRILAIETSCDDTCVAVLDLQPRSNSTFRRPELLFDQRITSDNVRYGGIHPLRSMESHHANLAPLIQEAMQKPDWQKPDLVAVTMGPGMRVNLQCGIDVAKGLSVAWEVPLVGVHHMQAHALTPRLHMALATSKSSNGADELKSGLRPSFPFLSLLVSGGHSLLVNTQSLTDHRILATTSDIAVGNCLDQIARLVLPQDILNSQNTVAYGSLLEAFAFEQNLDPEHRQPVTYNYTAPLTLGEEFQNSKIKNKYGWHFPAPLLTGDGKKFRSMEFSFGGIFSHVERVVLYGVTQSTPRESPIGLDEARLVAQCAMKSVFEHLASRIAIYLEHHALSTDFPADAPIELVIGGGVSANGYLKHILTTYLSARGFWVHLSDIDLSFCRDNAAMIAWTAGEMVGATTAAEDFTLSEEYGESSKLGIRAIRRWSLENLLKPEKELKRERRNEEERDKRMLKRSLSRAQGPDEPQDLHLPLQSQEEGSRETIPELRPTQPSRGRKRSSTKAMQKAKRLMQSAQTDDSGSSILPSEIGSSIAAPAPPCPPRPESSEELKQLLETMQARSLGLPKTKVGVSTNPEGNNWAS